MADQFSVDIKGGPELAAKLKRLGSTAMTAAAGSLYRSAEKIMADSKGRYVPVDTGALRASGKVLPPEIDNREVTVVLGYGDETADYAIYVHENPDAVHPVGEWKYLETPAKAASRDIVNDLKSNLDDAFEMLA